MVLFFEFHSFGRVLNLRLKVFLLTLQLIHQFPLFVQLDCQTLQVLFLGGCCVFVLLSHLKNFVLRFIDLIFKTVDSDLLAAVVLQRISGQLPDDKLTIAKLANGTSLHIPLHVCLEIPALLEAVLAVGKAAKVTVRFGKVRLFLPHAVASVAPACILEILLVNWVSAGENVIFVVKHELPETNLERSTGF